MSLSFFIFVGLNMTEVQMTLAHQLGQRMAAAHASQPISPICQKSTKVPTYLRPPQPKTFRSWIQKLWIWTTGNYSKRTIPSGSWDSISGLQKRNYKSREANSVLKASVSGLTTQHGWVFPLKRSMFSGYLYRCITPNISTRKKQKQARNRWELPYQLTNKNWATMLQNVLLMCQILN